LGATEEGKKLGFQIFWKQHKSRLGFEASQQLQKKLLVYQKPEEKKNAAVFVDHKRANRVA
jgi:CRISPR/Cas system type I-B associated protein Csh2 (Cas7 group RAMP superfamily)